MKGPDLVCSDLASSTLASLDNKSVDFDMRGFIMQIRGLRRRAVVGRACFQQDSKRSCQRCSTTFSWEREGARWRFKIAIAYRRWAFYLRVSAFIFYW